MCDENLNTLNERLKYFLLMKQIPNIIFHGSSGSGKRTIVNKFLLDIYGGDKSVYKSNVMMVNCSHGKGIKFIREELKFFAKTNIQSVDVMFKSIVLLNADSLTVDAQSALRRCIESFSYNTRFFIIIENKQKLLNPILSRFCEIYVPEHNDGKDMNLHKKNLCFNYGEDDLNTNLILIKEKFENFEAKYTNKIELRSNLETNDSEAQDCNSFTKRIEVKLTDITCFSTELYESGHYVFELIENLGVLKLTTFVDIELLTLCYFTLKKYFRCEKLLFFVILKFIYINSMGSNDAIKNLLLIHYG
jgi:hypothetical protein